jgi:hypothetical protein
MVKVARHQYHQGPASNIIVTNQINCHRGSNESPNTRVNMDLN